VDGHQWPCLRSRARYGGQHRVLSAPNRDRVRINLGRRRVAFRGSGPVLAVCSALTVLTGKAMAAADPQDLRGDS
jgi:hypothetical protein